MKSTVKFLQDETAATSLEFALVASLIGVMIMVAVFPLGQIVQNALSSYKLP